MEENQVDETLQRGSVQIRPLIYGYVDFMALKSAVDLHIADTINSYGRPITLSEIASGIPDSPSPNIEKLGRIMRYLVREKIVTAHHSSDGAGETLYELNPTSRWLLRDSKLSMLPVILFATSVWQINSWQHLSECIKDGGSAYKKAYGTEIWELASTNPKFNQIFNDAMACLTKMSIEPFLTTYKDELGRVGSLVDVGGGTGQYISEVVKKHPHIKGINFDLPHVISTAPVYDGVRHVGGDMFEAVPNADAIIAKWILHNWSDDDCVKLLKNCRKAIPEKSGKVIIVDAVLEPEGNGPLDDVHVMMDLMMMVISPNGKERTEIEWKKLLEEGGFPRYKITKIPTSSSSIIEAFPE